MDSREAFDCAQTTLNRRGYTVNDGERDAGVLKAERKRRQNSVMGYSTFENSNAPEFNDDLVFDNVTVSIGQDSSKQVSVRASGVSTFGRSGPSAESYAVRHDIRTMLARCSAHSTETSHSE